MRDSEPFRPKLRPIRFKFAALKALNALHWMTRQASGIDLHTMLKSCYFADKIQLNREMQPIFGATYRAMRFGPVPLEIYEMAKGEAIWLPEVGRDAYPWTLQGFRLCLNSNDEPDMSTLSRTDRDAFEQGFSLSQSMTFDERTAATHGHDWQAASLGTMLYEDMLDETPNKEKIVAYLSESGPYMRL